MSDPDALRSIIRGSLRPRNGQPRQAHPILKLKRSLQSIRSLQASRHQQCPIMALPIDFQPTPTVTPVVSELAAPVYNNVAIASIIQPTHYSSTSTTSKTISCGRRHHRSREGNALYQGRRSGYIYYWILAVWTTQESNFQCESAEILW